MWYMTGWRSLAVAAHQPGVTVQPIDFKSGFPRNRVWLLLFVLPLPKQLALIEPITSLVTYRDDIVSGNALTQN